MCGGIHLENLAADGGPFDDIINALAEKLYNEKITKGYIDQALYDATAKDLLKAMNEGLGGATFSFEDPRNELKAFLEQNLYSFSAAKSLTELENMRSLMTNADGTIRSFEEFRNACLDAGYQFNVNWLRTEYNTAVAATQAAAQWQNFIDNGTEVLQYSTVGDDRVRPAHEILDGFTARIDDPIWNLIYPPNDWNCRCWVIPGKDENVDAMQLDETMLRENIPAQFQKNAGASKIIYNDTHPYFQTDGYNNQLSAERNYGMLPVEKLYQKFQWPAKIEFASKEEANAWWLTEAKGTGSIHVRDATGVVIELDDDYRHYIMQQKVWPYAANVVDIISKPDEIWSVRKGSKLQRYYIKYFDSTPLIVLANADDGMYGYDLQQGNAINKVRKGTLIYRK